MNIKNITLLLGLLFTTSCVPAEYPKTASIYKSDCSTTLTKGSKVVIDDVFSNTIQDWDIQFSSDPAVLLKFDEYITDETCITISPETFVRLGEKNPTIKPLNPNMMAMGDSLYNGMVAGKVSWWLAENSAPAQIARTIGFNDFIVPSYLNKKQEYSKNGLTFSNDLYVPEEGINNLIDYGFDLDERFSRPDPLPDTGKDGFIPSVGNVVRGKKRSEQMYLKTKAATLDLMARNNTDKNEIYFDNIAAFGARSEELFARSPDSIEKFINPRLKKFQKANVSKIGKNSVRGGQFIQYINSSYVLNPSKDAELNNLTPLDHVLSRQPKHLFISVGSNNGLLDLGFSGLNTNEKRDKSHPYESLTPEMDLIKFVKDWELLSVALEKNGKEIQHIYLNGLLSPKYQSNIIPAPLHSALPPNQNEKYSCERLKNEKGGGICQLDRTRLFTHYDPRDKWVSSDPLTRISNPYFESYCQCLFTSPDGSPKTITGKEFKRSIEFVDQINYELKKRINYLNSEYPSGPKFHFVDLNQYFSAFDTKHAKWRFREKIIDKVCSGELTDEVASEKYHRDIYTWEDFITAGPSLVDLEEGLKGITNPKNESMYHGLSLFPVGYNKDIHVKYSNKEKFLEYLQKIEFKDGPHPIDKKKSDSVNICQDKVLLKQKFDEKFLSTWKQGGFYSLDNIHPTPMGYSVLASAVLTEIGNSERKTILGPCRKLHEKAVNEYGAANTNYHFQRYASCLSDLLTTQEDNWPFLSSFYYAPIDGNRNDHNEFMVDTGRLMKKLGF